MAIVINLVDVAGEARRMYGINADEVIGRQLPEVDYRFRLDYQNGKKVTMHAGATADDVASYLAAN